MKSLVRLFALVLILIPPAAFAQLGSTLTGQRNQSIAVGATPTQVAILCPAGYAALSGGLDTLDTGVMTLFGSYPLFGASVSLLNQPDGATGAPTGWAVMVTNDGPGARNVAITVICAPISGVVAVVRSVTMAAAPATGTSPLTDLNADCPAGTVALGGGGAAANRQLVRVSTPTFTNGGLADRAAGTNPAPIGWSVSAVNAAAATTLIKAAVTCGPLSNVVTMVRAPVTVATGKEGNEAIVCPAGYIAVGGGADAVGLERRIVFPIVSTPVYNGYGYPIDRDGGGASHTAAAGWFAFVGNFSSGASLRLTVGVVCAQVAVVQPGTVVAVIEFYNTNLKHYFRTSSASEARGIDNGSAGAGWIRTGDNFAAYADGSNTVGSDVCRFYTFGANSHFYTAFADECAGLKGPNTRWVYEGLSFRIALPANQTNTGCAVGTFFVYRLYNDRFAFNDSNHRFTTMSPEVPRLQAQNWKYEGVAFCALNFSSGEPPA